MRDSSAGAVAIALPTDACDDTEPEAAISAPAGLPAHLPMWRQVVVLATWPVLEQLLAVTVGLVDQALAGRLDAPSMDAIGATGIIMWLMNLLQNSVGVGATAVIARSVGAGRTDEANHAFAQAITLSILWGGITAVAFWFLAPVFAHAMSLDAEVFPVAVGYLRWLAVTSPMWAMLLVGSACLRGAGVMRLPFLIMLVVNLTNIAVSIALVDPRSPIGGHGLTGIAIGTAVAWCVGGTLIIAAALRGTGLLRLKPSGMLINRTMISRIIRISVPALMENGGLWLGNFLQMMIVGALMVYGLADRPLGSHGLAVRIQGISFMLGFGFSVAAATMVGQYLGANDPASARRAARTVWMMTTVVMVSLGLSFIFAGSAWTRLFTDQEPYLSTVPKLLVFGGIGQVGFAAFFAFSGALRGAGDTKVTMWLTYIASFGVRLPLSYVLGVWAGMGLIGIWWAILADLMIRGGLFVGRYLQGGWTKIRV